MLDFEDAVPALARHLKDSETHVRYISAMALGIFRSHPETSVPALVAALGDADALVRVTAIDSLGQYKANARPALAAIQGLTNTCPGPV